MNLEEDIFCQQCEIHIADLEVFADVQLMGDGISSKVIGADLNLCEVCVKSPEFPIVEIRRVMPRPKPDGVT